LKKVTTLICLLAAGLVAGCGGGSKTVTQPATTPAATPTTPTTTAPAAGSSMGTAGAMPSSGNFDATQQQVLREIEAKVDTAASANGLTHVVSHCSADSPSQVTCSVRGTRSDGTQGNETDVIKVDQQTGNLTLVSQQ
jgi:hypothetical protein